MAINFPSSPAVSQTYTFGGRTWRWNGVGWQVFNATLLPEIGQSSFAQTVTLTAGSSTLVSFTLSPIVQIYSIDTTFTNSSAAAWVRVYLTNAAATADAMRPFRDDALSGTGLVAEIAVIASPLTINLSPIASAVNAESPRTSAYPVRITNTGTATATFTVTINYISLTVN